MRSPAEILRELATEKPGDNLWLVPSYKSRGNPMKLRLWENQERRCAYCAKELELEEAVIEHRTPIAGGGDDMETNLLVSCSSCNASKGNKSLEEWTNDVILRGL